MKKSLLFAFALAGMAALVSCASSGASKSTGESKSADFTEVVEHKGSAMGVPQPAWVIAATQNDSATLKRDSRFDGKTPMVYVGRGRELALVQSWVNNFDVSGAISREISTAAKATFTGGLAGGNNSATTNTAAAATTTSSTGLTQKQEEIVATLSKTQFSGMAREMDWWSLNRRKDTGAETYTYLVVYSISTENLEYQIARALGRVSAKDAEEKAMLDKMASALKDLEFNNIVQVPEGR